MQEGQVGNCTQGSTPRTKKKIWFLNESRVLQSSILLLASMYYLYSNKLIYS